MRLPKPLITIHRASLQTLVMLALAVASIATYGQAIGQNSQSSADPNCNHNEESSAFSSYFTNGKDARWTQINRAWHVSSGRYVLDGGYLPDSVGRDGFSVTHVKDKSWRNYVMQATFDITNPAHLPSPDVHNAFFFVRVQSPPSEGTFYRIMVWPKGTTDPRGGPHNGQIIPGGLISIEKYVEGSVLKYIDREYSNTAVGTNAIVIQVVDGTIRIWINGEQVIRMVDPHPIRYGGIGLGAIWEAQAWFDNVIVTPLKDHDDDREMHED